MSVQNSSSRPDANLPASAFHGLSLVAQRQDKLIAALEGELASRRPYEAPTINELSGVAELKAEIMLGQRQFSELAVEEQDHLIAELDAEFSELQRSDEVPRLTAADAADVLGCSAGSVRRWSDAGLIGSVYRTPGGARRFSRAQLDRFIGSMQQDPPVAA